MKTVTRITLAAALLAGASAAQHPAFAKKSKTPIAHVAAPANPIPWSAAEGKTKVEAGEEDGVYIWHTGDTVHIATTSTSKDGLRFVGVVKTDGQIGDVKTVHGEKKDLWKQTAPNTVMFSFDTHEAKDGLHFRLTGGKTLTLAAIEAQKEAKAPIFIGPGEMMAMKLPAVFNLSK